MDVIRPARQYEIGFNSIVSAKGIYHAVFNKIPNQNFLLTMDWKLHLSSVTVIFFLFLWKVYHR